MADPYIGEIRMFGGNFAPVGWAFCNGQLLSISEYSVLYNLLGTTYGGDGVQTFGVPDLRGRLPIHQSSAMPIGQSAGVESVTLTVAQIPQHAHAFLAVPADAEGGSPSGTALAQGSSGPLYAAANPDKAQTMNAGVIGSSGGSQPHDNLQPFLCVSFILALEGVFPSQG
jgi:microcystin-dependent protein